MKEQVILFDGVCNLCNGAVQFVIRYDKKEKFRFAALQSESGQKLLSKHHLPITDFNSFVLITGDRYLVKSSAALTVLKELGGIFRIFYLFMILPKSLRDWVYDTIARSRYRIFGENNACMVPTPALRQRFLS